MALSTDLISQFVKITKDTEKPKSESTVYGTIVEYNGAPYVKLDGSDLLTPVSTTTDTKQGERVTVLIKDHTATVTGNLSSPSARTDDVKEIGSKISEFEIIMAYKVSTEDLEAINATIESLRAKTANLSNMEAITADIENLQAKYASLTYVSAKDVEALNADIENLKAKFGEFTDISTEDLEAIYADITNLQAYNADFTYVSAEVLEAVKANIKQLEATKLSATDAELKFANIDFSNIDKATMEYFYSESGLIKNVTIGDATISGELIGVTIKGDLIEGNTIVAEKLVIKGEDGLYYKLNTDGITTEAEQTDYNSLNGQVIQAKSVTAEKIAVEDLVAFDATIGGFNIGADSLYSGIKETVDNTTRGIYLDNQGQMAVGDASNFIKYYKDQNGDYKLEISAKSLTIGSTGSRDVETALSDIQSDVDSLRDEITTLLRIESSRGTVFKNNTVSTVLSVVIYHGTQRITDSTTMKSVFGDSAYLQWKWQRINEDSFGIISSTDSRFGDNGFTFTLSPEDVDSKVTFMCELIT